MTKDPRGSRPAGLHVYSSNPCFVHQLDDASSSYEANNHDHNRDDEQNVDQAAGDVKYAEAENPQNEENYRKCPKHCPSPRSRVSSTGNP